MPPRWLSLLIVAFWLATTGWLIGHDLAPRFQSGHPPPYVIDLVEEVQIDARIPTRTHWHVSLNDREVFQARTWVQRAEGSNSFELVAELVPNYGQPDRAVRIGPMHLRRVQTVSRISRAGDLLALQFEIEARVAKSVLVPDGPLDVVMYLNGAIRAGQLFPQIRMQRQFMDIYQRDLEPIPLPPHGAVLVPLHPVNRIQGLRPNQTWRLPLVDPFANLVPGGSSGSLEARVLPEKQTLTKNGRAVSCWVIQYEGEGGSARTWVQQESGLVWRQEVLQGGERWVMDRARD